MGRMLSLWKCVPCTWAFVHCTIISLNFLHPEAQTLSPAFWIKTEHLSSRQDSPEAWFFPLPLYLPFTNFELIHAQLLISLSFQPLTIWSTSCLSCNPHYLGPPMFSTSSVKPFLSLHLNIMSSSSERTCWVSEIFYTHLVFLLIPVNFVYVYKVSLKL